MLHELRPMGFAEAARHLGVDIFEMVRILTNTDGMPDRLVFEADQLIKIKTDAGIESSWWTDESLPKDHNPGRQRVRAALQLLLDRGHIGAPGTRMDNVGRGLSPDDQSLVSEALNALASDGLMSIHTTPVATLVYINETGKARIAEIAAGKGDTAALSALYEE